METTAYTWAIAAFGALTFLPLLFAQFLMLIAPDSKQARDLIIGKGEQWRDNTHFRSALAFAWADLLLLLPLLILSYIGVFSQQIWGYILWFGLGLVSIYFSILFWVLEKSYTYPTCGWLAYYSYFWGFFLYWGIAAGIYSLVILL